MSRPTFGSLFAGVGGMDLGLERAGWKCRWQVEIDPYARRVLAKHWPDVRRWDDVRTFPPDVVDADDQRQPQSGRLDGQERGRAGDRSQACRWDVDLIAGGFPCQDISLAGKGAGLAGERSGLWYESARVVRVLRPRYVLVENVAALLVRGLDAVLGTLASDGYDAEWFCLPAAAVGAPQIRDRVSIVAHAADCRCKQLPSITGSAREGEEEGRMRKSEGKGSRLPHADRWGQLECSRRNRQPQAGLIASRRDDLERYRASRGSDQWGAVPADDPDSGVGRVASRVPNRVDRLRRLGNAVVPQVAEFIGRMFLERHTRED